MMREQHAGPAVYERPERARRTGKPEELTIRRTDTSRRGNAQMPGYAAASRQRKPSGARKNRGKQQRRNGQASYPSSASYAPRGDISTQQTLQLSQQDLFAQHVYSSHAVPSAYTAIGARPTQQAQSARAPQERLRTAWAALLARSRRFGPSLLLFAAALLGVIFAPALFYQTALPRETGAFFWRWTSTTNALCSSISLWSSCSARYWLAWSFASGLRRYLALFSTMSWPIFSRSSYRRSTPALAWAA